MKYFIYVIENKVNGKSYVGKTKDFTMRWVAHKSSDERTAIGKDIRSLGVDNFSFRVIDTADSPKEATGKERLYIHLFESNVPETGYNSPWLFAWDIAERNIDRWLVSRGRKPSNNIQPLTARRNASQ